MPDELSLAVVGARLDNKKRRGKPKGSRQMEILLCEPGEEITLVHEPLNPADANAIAVYSARGVQIGYIVADRTSILHHAWRDARDVRAIFQEPITGGAAIRVAFDRNPVLPVKKLADYGPTARQPPDGEWDGVDYIPPD